MEAEGSPSVDGSLIRRMLNYVVENPDAKDTLDGINEFWLSPGRAHQGKDKLRAVLDFLVETRGWLTKSKAGASATLYGLNKECLDEIKRFLEQGDEDD